MCPCLPQPYRTSYIVRKSAKLRIPNWAIDLSFLVRHYQTNFDQQSNISGCKTTNHLPTSLSTTQSFLIDQPYQTHLEETTYVSGGELRNHLLTSRLTSLSLFLAFPLATDLNGRWTVPDGKMRGNLCFSLDPMLFLLSISFSIGSQPRVEYPSS